MLWVEFKQMECQEAGGVLIEEAHGVGVKSQRFFFAVETDISFSLLLQGMEGKSVQIKREIKSHGFFLRGEWGFVVCF